MVKNSIIDAVNNFVDASKSQKDNINIFKLALQDAQSDDTKKAKSYSSNKYSELPEQEKYDFMSDLDRMCAHFVGDNVRSHTGDLYMFRDIWTMILDDQNKNIAKKNRKVLFPTGEQHRVTGDSAFACWTGLQVIDLDIKDENIACIVKNMLFDILSMYHWFLGIALSSSHNGIHIYTKIKSISFNMTARKTEYYYNFIQKYSAVFSALECISTRLTYEQAYSAYNISPTAIQFTEMIHWIDTAMCRPQQGAFIPFDPAAELNTNFIDESIGYNFNSEENIKLNAMSTTDPRLKEVFSRIKYFSDGEPDEKTVSIEDIDADTDVDVSVLKKKHYKYADRWKLANTLVHIFGPSNALIYLKTMCAGTPMDELRGYVNTAKSHNKEISEWAINELRTVHGFNITVKGQIEDVEEIVNKTQNDLKSPVEQLSEITNKTELFLKEGQFLSDIQDSIMEQMEDITILDAGAGFGKTEMVKRMGGRKILVVPYTSIIESKIEPDPEIAKNWICFYGKTRPTSADLFCSKKSFVMTVDKFSRLNIDDIKTAGFDTLWVDESHLLFTSEFRNVMAPAIDRIAHMPAKGTKVVLMSGTPTAENLFFPGKKYIKVTREVDTRIKNININFSYKKTESDWHMCEAMADMIQAGRRILYPTNDGKRRFKQITSCVQEILNERHYGRKINTFYYKKSNSGTKEMKDVNEDKTVGENDILGCTSFLSVGVDICDKFEFTVFFDCLMMPQEVEQFANRIRNNNLYINIFLKQYNNEGDRIDYTSHKPVEFDVTHEDMVEAYNLIQLCNDQIKRCGDEIKYNSIISSMVAASKYIVYDEEVPEYRIDWTQYLLHLFEDNYREYSVQMPCFVSAMKYYGYTVSTSTNDEQFTEAKRERINIMLKEVKDVCVSEFTTATFDLLDSLDANNFEIYSTSIKDANYDIFRSANYENDRINNNIKCTNVEAIIKNMPIISRMYKWYDFDVIKTIYSDNTSKTSNKINISKLDKICDFIYIETKRMQKRLDVADYSFILAARDFAKANPTVKKESIDKFISERTCAALNRIDKIVTFNPYEPENIIYKGAVDFVKAVKKQYEKLFNIYIETTKTSRKNGTADIRPFQLDYDLKESFADKYGDVNLKAVMGDEFTHRMRGISMENDRDDTDIDNISTVTTDIINNYNNETINATYLSDIPTTFSSPSSTDYYEYTETDGSAERFIEKQARQHADTIAMRVNNDNENIDGSTTSIHDNNKEKTLFDDVYDTETEKNEVIKAQKEELKTSNFSYNTEEDIELGVDWDLIDTMGLLGDDGCA